MPESAVSAVQSKLDHAVRHADDVMDEPLSPVGYHHDHDPFSRDHRNVHGGGAESPPEPGSPRDRYLRDLQTRRCRRDEERAKILAGGLRLPRVVEKSSSPPIKIGMN